MPDFVDLNKESLKVLYDAHQMMTKQIDHDATPEFLDELKSKICAGYTEESHPGVADLAKLFQDKSLNPFNFPFEYLLNGTLPVEPLIEKADDSVVHVLPTVAIPKSTEDSPKMRKVTLNGRPVKRKRLTTPKKSID